MNKEFWATITVILTVTTGQFLWLRSDIQRMEIRINQLDHKISSVKEDVGLMRGFLMQRIDDANLTVQKQSEAQ